MLVSRPKKKKKNLTFLLISLQGFSNVLSKRLKPDRLKFSAFIVFPYK